MQSQENKSFYEIHACLTVQNKDMIAVIASSIIGVSFLMLVGIAYIYIYITNTKHNHSLKTELTSCGFKPQKCSS